MKIIVTGGAGFIGSNIVDAYLERGHEVHIFDDLSTGQTANLNAVIRNFSREKCCELIDLEKIFAELDHGKYFYDWNHPNVEGCELIASVTSRALQYCFKNALGNGASNARPF